MKKYLLSAIAVFCLAGCGGTDTYNPYQETRYFAYVGEPAAVLYDNFGTPYKGIKYNDRERALIFHTQDIDREWSFVDYRYCDITFYLTDDVVTSWTLDGNHCAINEEKTGFFDGWFSDEPDSTPAPAPTPAFVPLTDDTSWGKAAFDDWEPEQEPEITRPQSIYNAPSDAPKGHVIAPDAF